ncbi:DMT family transporter [bacterium]|nr:DMT family transporter [bacterium]
MRKNPYFYALLSVVCWSTVATAFKLALEEIDFLQLLFYSTFFSALSLLVVIIMRGQLGLMLTLSRRHWPKSVLLGLFNPMAYYLVLFKAYDLLPAQQAQPLNYTWPLMLVLFSAFFHKEKITTKQIIGILISFSGVMVIATRGRLVSLDIVEPLGVCLAVGSSLLWATYWLLNIKDNLDISIRMFFNFFSGFCAIALLLFFLDHSLSISFSSLTLCLYIGLFEMGLTFVFWSKALQMSQSTVLSQLVYLSPFISLIFIRLILKETIMLSSGVGLVLIIAGIVIGQRMRRN